MSKLAIAALMVLSLTACAAPRALLPEGGFVQTLGRAHPLSGKVYASASRGTVSASELLAAVERADYVIVGESHDNRDHHALEARLVELFLDSHPAAAIGFEMLDEDVRPVLRDPPSDPDELARAVHWEQSGWPEFAQYRPVFAAALARRARLIAAHPSRAHVRASMAGTPEPEASALKLDSPLPAAAQTRLEDEIRASHCGHAPDAMLLPMVRAQSYKDAFMARSIFESGPAALLVTGNGHARGDRGVPRFLHLRGAARVLSVGLIEVDDARREPQAYDIADYDYVVFSPRTSDEDPCARFEEQLKSLKAAP